MLENKVKKKKPSNCESSNTPWLATGIFIKPHQTYINKLSGIIAGDDVAKAKLLTLATQKTQQLQDMFPYCLRCLGTCLLHRISQQAWQMC
jgi:hypothetical protein